MNKTVILIPLVFMLGGCSVQEARSQVDAAKELHDKTTIALRQAKELAEISPEFLPLVEQTEAAHRASADAIDTAANTLAKIEAAQAAGGGVLDLVLAAAGALIPGAAGIALALQRIRKLNYAVSSTAKYADKLEEGVTDSGLISEAKTALIAAQSARGIHALVQGIRGK